jgi:hypothetical protein
VRRHLLGELDLLLGECLRLNHYCSIFIVAL